MDDRAREYRAKLDELRRRGGARWRTPQVLRDEIAAWARKLRAEGHRLGSIAAAIGLSESALGRWLSSGGGGGELRRVRVVEGGPAPGRLVVVTPAGYRLEGLSLSQAVDVLRRL